MKKRWRLFVLLGAPLAALATGVWWWHRTTPPWGWASVQWGSLNDLRYAYEGELRVPSIAKAVGYSAAQLRADDAVRMQASKAWRAMDAETRRMQASGASEESVLRYRSRAIPEATVASGKLLEGWLPCLTPAQKSRLWPYIVHWTGVWVMADRRVAARVGLSEVQRRAFADAADRLRWYYIDEQNAWTRTEYIYAGAPAATIATLGETFRHTAVRAAREKETGEPAIGPDDFYRTHSTEFSPVREMPSWIDTLHYDLVVRRAVAYRREEEARLLGTLTPEQRRRWESLKAGQDPV